MWNIRGAVAGRKYRNMVYYKKIDYVNLNEVNNDVIANILQLYSPCFVPAFTLGCCPVAWAGVQ